MSYVEMALKWLRVRGINYGLASGYNAYSHKRWDLLGVFDYVGFERKYGKVKLLGIQICGQDFQPHVRKINSSALAKMWVESGNGILLIGFRKLKSTGWTPRITQWHERGDFRPVQSTQSISKPSKPPDLSNF